ncbi:helix-turn-helix domain-containing protein [Spongisporangium articulatum]|uniref:Helix-turn-helix domain-containing protein n=1 Tax=Spongisporangium articulatum TaxID=3362603 RepID=A0ABW8AQY6_9ACTN
MTNVVPMNNNSAVYTVEEVKDLLRIARGAAYAMVQNGEIPAKKIGTRWVIPKARFHAWLNDLPEASLEDIAREFLARRPIKVLEVAEDDDKHTGRGA